MLNPMRRIVGLLGGFVLLALPVSGAGLMELLDSMKPVRPERSAVQLPPLPMLVPYRWIKNAEQT